MEAQLDMLERGRFCLLLLLLLLLLFLLVFVVVSGCWERGRDWETNGEPELAEILGMRRITRVNVAML